MENEKTDEIKLKPCKYCSETHSINDQFCPKTGKPISRLRFHRLLNIVLSVIVIALISLVGIFIFKKEPVKTILPLSNPYPILKSYEDSINLSAGSQATDIQFALDMAEAYLARGGVLNITRKQNPEGGFVEGNAADNSGKVKIRVNIQIQSPQENKEKPSKSVENLVNTPIDRTEEYNSYLTLANEYYNIGKWDKAGEYTDKAIRLKNTPEIQSLDQKIRQVRQGNLETLNLDDANLIAGYRENFLSQIEAIVVPIISQDATIEEKKNQITLSLLLNEKGIIKIDEFIANNLEIRPAGQKQLFLQKIRERIEKISFVPPRKNTGVSVKIKTWRFAYKIQLGDGKLILLRRS
ncbi:MAG TPA: hypothetical protein VK186_28360 [Candidatus Deferrimicrobium sp.]|nr:hypothetical protein [Candidatus Deferrimicrobium sp.]